MIRENLTIANFDARLDHSDLQLIKSAFGREGVKFFIRNFKGRPTDISLAEIINHNLFRTMSDELGGAFTPEAYIGSLKKAAETHQYVVETLNLPEWDAGLLNEVVACSDSPFDRLDLLSAPNTSDLLRYQIAEQLLLGFVAAGLDNRTRSQKLRSLLSGFVGEADRLLFSGLNGQTKPVEIYSTHDTHNNSVIRIEKKPFAHQTSHERQKKTILRTRTVNIGGKQYSVVFDIRKKDDRSATLKTLEKAIHNDGCIDFNNDVVDMIGIKFVVLNGNIKDFLNVFEQGMGNTLGVTKIENDDVGGSQRLQSGRHRFRRRQLYFDNGSRLEMLFYTLREFLNSVYDIGNQDEQGNFDGAAHSLYEVKRIGHTAQHLFPSEIYGLDIPNFLADAQQKRAENLLRANAYECK